MKSNIETGHISADLAARLILNLHKGYAPKRGVDMPCLTRDQVLRDTLDAAHTLPFWDARRAQLVKQASDLRSSN